MRKLQAVDDRNTGGLQRDGLIRVVLANDHPGLRRSLRNVLDHEDDFDVVGEASDFEATVREVSAQHPQVLVLDLRMPDGFNAERIKRLRALSPSTGIVVTTMHLTDRIAKEALSAGAIGFVVADSADRELVEAVRCASRGLAFTSPRVRQAVSRQPRRARSVRGSAPEMRR